MPNHISYDHSTTQRIQFPGIDTTEFKKAKSCKQPEIGYVVPSEKVLGESVTMVLLIQIFFMWFKKDCLILILELVNRENSSQSISHKYLC